MPVVHRCLRCVLDDQATEDVEHNVEDCGVPWWTRVDVTWLHASGIVLPVPQTFGMEKAHEWFLMGD